MIKPTALGETNVTVMQHFVQRAVCEICNNIDPSRLRANFPCVTKID